MSTGRSASPSTQVAPRSTVTSERGPRSLVTVELGATIEVLQPGNTIRFISVVVRRERSVTTRTMTAVMGSYVGVL